LRVLATEDPSRSRRSRDKKQQQIWSATDSDWLENKWHCKVVGNSDNSDATCSTTTTEWCRPLHLCRRLLRLPSTQSLVSYQKNF
jgi:hypothetical protein